MELLLMPKPGDLKMDSFPRYMPRNSKKTVRQKSIVMPLINSPVRPLLLAKQTNFYTLGFLDHKTYEGTSKVLGLTWKQGA